MSEKPASNQLEGRVKTLNEVASLLRISRGSAYEAAKRREIPTIRIGRRLLVPSDALEKLLSGNLPAGAGAGACRGLLGHPPCELFTPGFLANAGPDRDNCAAQTQERGGMSTAEEMEAGGKRSQYFANPGANRPQPMPDPTGSAAHPAARVATANALAGDSAANLATPKHDKAMARRFLAGLDPNATKFTFQLFSDDVGSHRQIFHGSLDELWPKVLTLNTSRRGVGVFVTISETDFKGRSTNNIVRPRAIFADADGKEQVERCRLALEACGASSSITVNSGRGYHFYFCTDVPRDQFSLLQEQLSTKLGTDPAVKDLPRVMRLPGTLHLKDPTKPRLVKLLNSPNRRRGHQSSCDGVDNQPLNRRTKMMITSIRLRPPP